MIEMKQAAIHTCLAIMLTSPASAATANQNQKRLPRFSDYPVQIYRGARLPLRLVSNERDFRTRYRQTYSGSPNFAGHYSVGFVGCGFSCIFLLKVDHWTGKPAHLDIPAGENNFNCSEEYRDAKGDFIEKRWDFRPNSRLMIVTGSMPGNECGIRYLVESGGKMKLIREVRLRKAP